MAKKYSRFRITRKKVLMRVDFNVPMKEGKLQMRIELWQHFQRFNMLWNMEEE